ncbi:MAG: flagellar assembly protein FliW [Peptococcaceae bacterium]|nr:flagellar assembly protein FliW [Peptococcaceae bacterium]
MQDESVIVQFPEGIPGFEEYDTFAMTLEEDAPLAHLTLSDDEDCGFLLLQPQALFGEDVPQVNIDDSVTTLLELQEGDSADMWVIVTLGQDVRESTANLRAPLLINKRTHKGVQMILDDDVYQSTQPLFH